MKKTKQKTRVVDLQVNGAWGIDLFRAQTADLSRLSERLGRAGVEAFCPTLITASERMGREAITRVGAWVESCWNGTAQRRGDARPLGLHLEGPFLNPGSRGVHPASAMRLASLSELEKLWTASRGTIRLMTVAPEVHSAAELKVLTLWARRRKVRLSIGHSRATYDQARRAFDLGFSGVTHAWNAMPFHHRDPGVLGAALGRDDVTVMIIPDGVHVHGVAIDWVLKLHKRVVLVSDCAPSAGLRDGGRATFGTIAAQQVSGEARLAGHGNAIAGSGMLLPSAASKLSRLSAVFAQASAAQRARWLRGEALRWLLRGDGV